MHQSRPLKASRLKDPQVLCLGRRILRRELQAWESPPGYKLEEEQDLVCLTVEPLRVGKAKKGLGPSRGRAVGWVPVLLSLTLVQRPGVTQPEEPMEVGDSLGSDSEWLLEVSEVKAGVPQGSGPVASKEAITKKVPVVPQKEVVVRKGPEMVKKGPENPATREVPAKPVGKSRHFRHEVVDGDKYGSWRLAPGRAILIIGDSNLSRIPEANNGAVEVHSFPGVTLAQAFSLVKYKTPASDRVWQVVLCFGLNDRGQSNVQALRKCIERLLDAAAATFPNAVLHITLINYEPTLSEQQVRNLWALNDIIFRTGHCVPLLLGGRFQVGSDQIHWTVETAQAMLQHWLAQLNC